MTAPTPAPLSRWGGVQSRGALRRELTRCLRTGRALRKPGRQVGQRKNRIPDMVSIAERPPEADERTVPGHWEGDLLIGKRNQMRDWKQVHLDAGIEVYFCDPHAPWQRGTNENTNGLLRQYFPKGADFSGVTEAALDAVANELNDRPRKRLGFYKPTEKIADLLLQ